MQEERPMGDRIDSPDDGFERGPWPPVSDPGRLFDHGWPVVHERGWASGSGERDHRVPSVVDPCRQVLVTPIVAGLYTRNVRWLAMTIVGSSWNSCGPFADWPRSTSARGARVRWRGCSSPGGRGWCRLGRSASWCTGRCAGQRSRCAGCQCRRRAHYRTRAWSRHPSSQ